MAMKRLSRAAEHRSGNPSIIKDPNPTQFSMGVVIKAMPTGKNKLLNFALVFFLHVGFQHADNVPIKLSQMLSQLILFMRTIEAPNDPK